jgi:DNA-binding MarR family transcriptional regulator
MKIASAKNAPQLLRASGPVMTASMRMESIRGIGAWLAVVRTYQKCSEVLSAQIKPLGLKLAQHDVMMSLLVTPEQTQQQLAEKSFVTKSHMSAVLTEMAALGWVSRADSSADRRSKVIALTPSGLAVARRALAAQAKVVAVMMDPLTDKQIAELEKLSRNAVTVLSNVR